MLRQVISCLLLLALTEASCAVGQEKKATKANFAESYQAYLAADFPATFESFVVGEKTIELTLKVKNNSRYEAPQLAIAVLPAHVPSQQSIDADYLVSAPVKRNGNRFAVKMARRRAAKTDRSHCRFVLVHKKSPEQLIALSAATYPTTWAAGIQRKLKKMVAKDRKGLGGIPRDSDRKDHEIYSLGLSHATINIVLNGLIHSKPRPGFTKWKFEGQAVYINERLLGQYDRRLRQLRKNDIVASVILLIGNKKPPAGADPTLLVHPESNETGKFAMPNLATAKGAFLYRAIITRLAKRFSQDIDGAARVSNWILHNEIDQAGTWTTMGPQPIERYMETFTRSARLVHHVARQFNPHARVFVSLTHHWNKISAGQETYRVRDMLDLMAVASNVEGDFEWGVAYHPYPQNLREPRTWLDKNVNFTFNSPLVTPRNIEVLPAYLAKKHMCYQGKEPRAILLSEQGCNAKSLSSEDQQLQAAGIVYMFHRMRLIPTVEAFHYHAYKDHPEAEGGMRLGLTTEKDEHKYAWDVYAALNSNQEKKQTRFAWPIMGPDAAKHARRLRKVQ